MLIHVRNKDNHKLQYVGIAIQQWYVGFGFNKKLRIYVLCPNDTKLPGYCDVDCLIEEVSDWKIIGIDEDFSNRSLAENELQQCSKQTEEDLYCVWDDGASECMERAERLYATFKDEIEQHGHEAKRARDEAAREIYKQDVIDAKSEGWDSDIIPAPNLSGNFGGIS